MWALHILFIAIMFSYFFLSRTTWFYESYRAISLTHEMTYAVWWSGICLFLAAITFLRAAELDRDRTWVWIVLALAMTALCMDEIGSLHETVARAAGWRGLAPFALVFGCAFLWALSKLVKQKEFIPVAMLIVLGVGIFVAVAGLEFVEHNVIIYNVHLQKLRLIGEEAIELVAMGILVTAGLIACRNAARANGSSEHLGLVHISKVFKNGFRFDHWLFVIFALQMTVTIAYIVPNYTFFPEGNVSSLFPILLFLSMGLYCLNKNLSEPSKGWRGLGWVFVITSVLQVYNFNEFVNKLFQIEWEWLLQPPASWLVTLVPWLWLVVKSIRAGRSALKQVLGQLLLLVLVIAMMSPDFEFLYRIDFLYFAFSSCVAYCCFLMLKRIQD